MADQPTDPYLLTSKGWVLTFLGDYAEAEKALKLAAEFSGKKPDLLELRIAEGQLDAAMDILESRPHETAATLRLSPQFDPLRNTPRFKALLARAEADPKRSPQPPMGSTANDSQPDSRN
jgi:thioredoxin-like negative regulator of GroEL